MDSTVRGKTGDYCALEAKRRNCFKEESLISFLVSFGHFSSSCSLKVGVPQGPVLGSFLTYTHSLGDSIPSHSFNIFSVPKTPKLSSVHTSLLNTRLDYPTIYSSSPLEYLTSISNLTY